MIQNKALIDRFLRYVRIDTQSSEKSDSVPTTEKQHDLAKLLYGELKEMGIEDVLYDKKNCLIYASLPASGLSPSGRSMSEWPAVGFIAHMDTSDAVSGSGVAPRFIMNYDGNDPLLPETAFDSLKDHLGCDLIATDGTTLLGADDKAGVAEIMAMAGYFTSHPDVPHRAIAIAFTPDEETGHGVDHFDPALFKAEAAYTADGDRFGCVEYETFNAAAAAVTVRGASVHPGSAKGIMKNASLIAMEFNAALPENERPERTEGREGFYMLMEMTGEVEKAVLRYIIRDHDRGLFEKRKQALRDIAASLNGNYGEGTVEVTVNDQYYNMAEILKDRMDLIRDAEDVIRSLGREPVSKPVRGGTDGSRLTFMGIPCPNLGTGGYNFHSRFEYACIQEMELAAEALIRLASRAV